MRCLIVACLALSACSSSPPPPDRTAEFVSSCRSEWGNSPGYFGCVQALQRMDYISNYGATAWFLAGQH